MFKYNFTLRLHHTDAAGAIFFSNLFTLAHECYEEFLKEIDFPIAMILKDRKIIIPIVAASAEYYKLMSIGEKFLIQMRLVEIQDSGFELNYDFSREKSAEKVAKARTRHIVIEKDTRNVLPVPTKLINAFSKF